MENQTQLNNVREKAVDKIIELLEQNPEVWKKTWVDLNALNTPINPISGVRYKGMNYLMLSLVSQHLGFDDPRWCTFLQAKSAGCPVKAGEKSIASVIFHKTQFHLYMDKSKIFSFYPKLNKMENFEELTKFLSEKNPEKAQALQNLLASVKASAKNIDISSFCHQLKPIFGDGLKITVNTIDMASAVFNFKQLENAPVLEQTTQLSWNPCERAENIINNSGVTIYHDQTNINYYDVTDNSIHLTKKQSFLTQEAYYSTVLHEVSHSVMSSKVVELSFDPNQYSASFIARAREELRAELSSVFTSAEIGLHYDVQNHSSYIAGWLKLLKENKNELWSAVAEANKVANVCLDFENTKTQTKELSTANVIASESTRELSKFSTKFLDIPLVVSFEGNNEMSELTRCFLEWNNDVLNITKYSEYVSEIKNFSGDFAPKIMINPFHQSAEIIKMNDIFALESALNLEFNTSVENNLTKNQYNERIPQFFTKNHLLQLKEAVVDVASSQINEAKEAVGMPEVLNYTKNKHGGILVDIIEKGLDRPSDISSHELFRSSCKYYEQHLEKVFEYEISEDEAYVLNRNISSSLARS